MARMTVESNSEMKPIFHTTVISTAWKNGLIDDVLDNFGVTPDIQPAVKNPGIYLDYGTSEMIQKTAKFS